MLPLIRHGFAVPPSPEGNVINLSIDHRAVGGDAHIAPRGMVSFWYHTAANS